MPDIFKKYAKLNGWFWRLVVAIISFSFGAGVALATMRGQLHELAKEDVEIKKCLSDQEDRVRDLEKFAPRIDESLKNIDRRLSNIEDRNK